MSRSNEPAGRIDLMLNLSPPRPAPTRVSANHPRANTTNHVVDSLHNSPPSSCISSDQNEPSRGSSSSPESASSVMLVGCPRCLMYVMMPSEEDQRCPKCKSTVLLTIVKDDDNHVKTSKS